jgi:hypothetical protein
MKKKPKSYCQVKNKVEQRVRILPNVTFEDDEFKDNKALNDQGKDEGTIIVTAQLNLNMSWSLT